MIAYGYSILQVLCLVIGYIVNNLRMSLQYFGFKGGDFGTCIVSNVGVFGIKKGIPPLLPFAGVGMDIVMGKI